MYLILIRGNSSQIRQHNEYNSIFTDSILEVAKAFQDTAGIAVIKVYKIDGLMEVKEIDIEIKETLEKVS